MTTIAKSPMATGDAYPSRTGDRYRFLPRREPIVYGDAEHGPLDAQALANYAEKGFLHLPGYFASEEIRPAKTQLACLREDRSLRARPEAITEPDSGALRSLFAVHFGQTPFAVLCRDSRLAAIAWQILASDIYILQSRINYKPGFAGRGFFWHSDFETWHVEDGLPRMRALSCSINLTTNDETNGPLMLVPGSHRRFLSCAGETPEENYKRSLKRQELGVPDAAHLATLVEEGDLVSTPGPAGSVTLFDCNLMHGSNSNITPWPRSNVFIVFNSVENRLVEPFGAPAPRPEFLAHRRRVTVLDEGSEIYR
ncbi:MAG: ectoine hydroxylase [Gammaproteobacteria bacterium]